MRDAVSIEYAFAHLLSRGLGGRGMSNDADVFRVGDSKSLAKILTEAADAIESRSKKAGFQGVNPENGSPAARIGVALDELRREAVRLKLLNTEEGESYQWQVIGSLVSVIAAMLEIAESK